MPKQKPSGIREQQRAVKAKARAAIWPALQSLEKEWGEGAVSSAISRYFEVRRQRRKLAKAKAAIADKIAKLGGA